MATTDRFSRLEFQRILDVTEKQLSYWEKLRLVAPRKKGAKKTYDFRDLITLRTAKQLIEKGVSAQRLQRSIVALQKQLAGVKSPLTELRIRSNGRDVIVERAGMHLEPISGQILLNFETRELHEKVYVMPQRNADDWVTLGVEREQMSETGAGLRGAAEAYQSALNIDPGHVDALNNLGMLSYEQGVLSDALVLFGVTGDLAHKMIFPALYAILITCFRISTWVAFWRNPASWKRRINICGWRCGWMTSTRTRTTTWRLCATS